MNKELLTKIAELTGMPAYIKATNDSVAKSVDMAKQHAQQGLDLSNRMAGMAQGQARKGLEATAVANKTPAPATFDPVAGGSGMPASSNLHNRYYGQTKLTGPSKLEKANAPTPTGIAGSAKGVIKQAADDNGVYSYKNPFKEYTGMGRIFQAATPQPGAAVRPQPTTPAAPPAAVSGARETVSPSVNASPGKMFDGAYDKAKAEATEKLKGQTSVYPEKQPNKQFIVGAGMGYNALAKQMGNGMTADKLREQFGGKALMPGAVVQAGTDGKFTMTRHSALAKQDNHGGLDTAAWNNSTKAFNAGQAKPQVATKPAMPTQAVQPTQQATSLKPASTVPAAQPTQTASAPAGQPIRPYVMGQSPTVGQSMAQLNKVNARPAAQPAQVATAPVQPAAQTPAAQVPASPVSPKPAGTGPIPMRSSFTPVAGSAYRPQPTFPSQTAAR
jgi:hypothetical protein